MSEEVEFSKQLMGYTSSIIDGMQVLNTQIGRNIETSAGLKKKCTRSTVSTIR